MLVVRDGELKTKIARREKRGQNYVETQIMKGAGDTVSQPATTGGGYREHLHPTRQYTF